jgi:hypothetical protein
MHLNLIVKWKIQRVVHISLLESIIQEHREINLEEVIDAADPIETDNEYHIKEVTGSVDKKGKVSYLVKWRELPAKQDWTREDYENFYSVGGKEEVLKLHSKNPESSSDAAFTIKKYFFPNVNSSLEHQDRI